jgi:alpha-glucosidase
LWWGTPEDRALRDCEDAFLLGDSLLVAPVLEPGARRRTVFLPRGRWYDTTTEEAYQGPGHVRIDAPLGRIPVLARAGAVLPVRAEDGGLELEVWAPARGRSGSGVVVPDPGAGWAEAVTERYVTRWKGRKVVVRRDGDDSKDEPTYPVRLRGLRTG